MSVTIAQASFGIAAAAYLLLTALLAVSYWQSAGSRWLLAACACSALWAGALLNAVPDDRRLELWLWPADLLHAAVWLLFLASLFPVERRQAVSVRRSLFLVAGATSLWAAGTPWLPVELRPAGRPAMVALLMMSLLGLSAIEQVFRNSDVEGRRLLKPLCIGVGALFTFDLFVYSHGVLFTRLDRTLWVSRGVLNAIVAIPLLIGARSHSSLLPHLFVSRSTLYYSAAFIGSGAYLVAMALVGSLIRARIGEWGVVFQVAFLAASALVLAFILSSAQFRARLKVFISKHFYRYRYDYREEWLRLIATLSNRSVGGAPERALKALTDILHSRSGELWISRAPGAEYEPIAWLQETAPKSYPDNHPLIRFLAETNWIVDTEQYARDPDRYSHAFRAVSPDDMPPASVFVPLRHEDRLLGLARLDRPPGVGGLNYEDHDLLKTVGRQTAVFVEEDIARERLAETRQFEAFNRTTAFLMHDLKNLIAQQALIVQNAPRYKHNPEFVEDAISTIERSVLRMRRLLEQLQRRSAEPSLTRVSLTSIVEEVAAEASAHTPAPTLTIEDYCEVRGDRDRLAMVITHAVRNAQDATPASGCVDLRVSYRDGEAIIEVADTGKGMDEHFIRERLFRPFDTTKPGTGMGIGAYQIREYIKSLGGRVEVHSRLEHGTQLRMIIPGDRRSLSPEVNVPSPPETRAQRAL